MLKIVMAVAFAMAFCNPVVAHPGNHQAIEILSHRIDKQATAQAYLKRAQLYIDESQFKNALADIESSEQQGKNPFTYYLKAQIDFKQGRLQDAIEKVSLFLQHQPHHQQALELRAKAYEKLNNNTLSFADLEQVITSSPQTNPAMYISAATAAKKAYGVKEALVMIDSGIAKLGIIPQLQQQAISYEIEQHQWKNALARLDTLKPQLNANPQWHVQRGELLLKLSETSAALEAFDHAEKLIGHYRKTNQRQQLLEHILHIRQNLPSN